MAFRRQWMGQQGKRAVLGLCLLGALGAGPARAAALGSATASPAWPLGGQAQFAGPFLANPVRHADLVDKAEADPLQPESRAKPADDSVPRVARSFHDFWRDLASLREAELRQRADELWIEEPSLTLRAMILRLGREVPATVTAARRTERLAIRRAALEWLQQRLAISDAERDLWKQEVESLLADPEQTILWCATARSLGRLGDYEFSEALGARIDASNPQLAQAAQLALFDLYLRWFKSSAEFEAFWPEAEQSCLEGLSMATARAMEQAARETLIQLLAYEPQRATSLLQDADPRLRAAAAATIGRARNGETEGAVETLLSHLETEVNGNAFQATIDALLQTQGAAPVHSPDLNRLRSILKRRLDEGFVDLQAPLADALRRLKWTESEEGSESLLAGLALLAGQVLRLADPNELTDRDVVVSGLFSLQTLASRAQKAGLPVASSMMALRPLVTDMIEDPREAEVVRIAASQFLPLVGRAADLSRVADVLSDESSSASLRYNLLAALGDLASELELGEVESELVLATLLRHLDGGDANLRRRALSYLRAELLADVVHRADPSVFVASLGRETVPDFQAQLLELIATFGGLEQVDELIGLPNFDVIVASGPAGVAKLAQTIRGLSQGEGAHLLLAAQRLLAGSEGGSRVLRLREALSLVASISADSILILTPAENHDIVLWASEMREAAGALPGGQEFLARLTQHHLPGCEKLAEDASKLDHVRALFLSDLIALDPSAGQDADVLQHFDAALARATETQDSMRYALVLRDRARFGHRVGRKEAALADYRKLFESELPVTPVEAVSRPVRTGVLELSDLRRGADLVAGELAQTPESKERAGQALRISLVLVQDPIWKQEPAAVRSQDLRQLVERALHAGDRAAMERANTLLGDLPDLPAAANTEAALATEVVAATPAPAPAGALWGGLLSTRESHTALLELRQRLRLALEPVATQVPGEQAEPGPDKANSEDPPPALQEGAAEPKIEGENTLRASKAPASSSGSRG